MKRSTAPGARALAACALLLPASLVACGSAVPSATSAPVGPSPVASSVAPPRSNGPDAGAGTFGPGCSAFPTSGDGSFATMSGAPLATAVAGNPQLRTLAAALTEADLLHRLDATHAVTLLAPTDDAFARLGNSTLDHVLADRRLLRDVLEHHVLRGRLSPDELPGRHRTLSGDTVDVAGAGTDLSVADGAKVLCGNIATTNATIYMIDTVLVPGS